MDRDELETFRLCLYLSLPCWFIRRPETVPLLQLMCFVVLDTFRTISSCFELNCSEISVVASVLLSSVYYYIFGAVLQLEGFLSNLDRTFC